MTNRQIFFLFSLLFTFATQSSGEMIFAPEENDFIINFPSSPEIKQEGRQRRYAGSVNLPSVQMPTSLWVTATDLPADNLLHSEMKDNDQYAIEVIFTEHLFPKLAGKQNSDTLLKHTGSFAGVYCIFYESLDDRIWFSIGAVFTKSSKRTKKATTYGVSMYGVATDAREQQEIRSEFTRRLATFSFIEQDEPQDLPEAPIAINSAPPGATVYINGREAGQTPLAIKLKKGTYMVELEMAGYGGFATPLQIVDTNPKSVDHSLSKEE